MRTAPDSCPTCGGRINPGPEPDTYDAWQARLRRTNRHMAEEAMKWFATHYPDPWDVILERRKALHDETTRLRAPGRNKTKSTA